MQPERFRRYFLQQLLPLFGLPLLALLLTLWPITDSWSRPQWTAVALVAVLIAAWRIAAAWRTAEVLLDGEGIHVWEQRTQRVWAWQRLLGLTQFGRFRVRLCIDSASGDGAHQHVSLDLWRPDDFAGAIEDWHERITGRPLGDPHGVIAA
jgi:hypothetical protein